MPKDLRIFLVSFLALFLTISCGTEFHNKRTKNRKASKKEIIESDSGNKKGLDEDADDLQPLEAVEFSQVQEVMDSHSCAACHSYLKNQADYDTEEKLNKVIASMQSGEMPPSGERVPDDEIGLVVSWLESK